MIRTPVALPRRSGRDVAIRPSPLASRRRPLRANPHDDPLLESGLATQRWRRHPALRGASEGSKLSLIASYKYTIKLFYKSKVTDKEYIYICILHFYFWVLCFIMNPSYIRSFLPVVLCSRSDGLQPTSDGLQPNGFSAGRTSRVSGVAG